MTQEWEQDLEVVDIEDVQIVDEQTGEVVEVLAVEAAGVGPDGELVDVVLVDEFVDGELVSETVDIVAFDEQGDVVELTIEADLDHEGDVEVDRPGPTGDPRVDDAIGRLGDVPRLPTADQVAVYDEVHRRLQSALGDLDPDPAAGS